MGKYKSVSLFYLESSNKIKINANIIGIKFRVFGIICKNIRVIKGVIISLRLLPWVLNLNRYIKLWVVCICKFCHGYAWGLSLSLG